MLAGNLIDEKVSYSVITLKIGLIVFSSRWKKVEAVLLNNSKKVDFV